MALSAADATITCRGGCPHRPTRSTRSRTLGRWRARWWWLARRRPEQRYGDRRQSGNLHDGRADLRRRGRDWAAAIRFVHRLALDRRWWRRGRYAVAGVDRDDRAGNRLTARRGPHHRTIGCGTVHRCRLVGHLKARIFEALTRRIHFEAGHTGHPTLRRTVDVARICRRKVHVAEIGGDRFHRLEPRAGGLVAAVQVAAAALAQRE